MRLFPLNLKSLTLISYGLIINILGCVPYSVPEENARTKIKGIARGEIAHIYELNRFTSNFNELGLNINPETKYYSYKFILIDEERIVQFAAVAKQLFLRSYTGVTYIYIDEERKEASAKYIICESDNPTQKIPDRVELIDNKVKCPNGYSLIE